MTALVTGSMGGTKIETKFDSTDEIIGLGFADLTSTLSKEKPPIALIGVKYLYLIAQGQEELNGLTSLMLNSKLLNINNGQTIEIIKNSSNEFSIELSITYDKPKNQLSKVEEEYLQKQIFIIKNDSNNINKYAG